MSISFELPFHSMCTEHQAILQSSSGCDFLDLDQVGLEQMPDVIIFNSKRYRFAGVSDGRGQYIEELPAPKWKESSTALKLENISLSDEIISDSYLAGLISIWNLPRIKK